VTHWPLCRFRQFVSRERSAASRQPDQQQHLLCWPLSNSTARPLTERLTLHHDRGVGGVDGPIAALLATNYSILDTFKQNMQTWRVSRLCAVANAAMNFFASPARMTCEDLVDMNFGSEAAASPLLQVNENTELLMQFRDNILGILNHMTTMGGVMVRGCSAQL
jgi:Protein of unknown function (DUF3755)